MVPMKSSSVGEISSLRRGRRSSCPNRQVRSRDQLETARSLSLTIPLALQVDADEVIE
jgi:hypothetical protein